MKLRFTTKSFLVLTTAICCACAWYASAVTASHREKAAIAEIAKFCSTDVWTGEGGYVTCGNWTGTRLGKESLAPVILQPILRKLGIDTFDRVRRIEFYFTQESRLVGLAHRFKNLESIHFQYSTRYMDSEKKHHISSMTGALQLFAALNPDILVHYPAEQQLIDDGIYESNDFDLAKALEFLPKEIIVTE